MGGAGQAIRAGLMAVVSLGSLGLGRVGLDG
jgi:hypothetical protein